jgi:hypothetical protein
MEGRRLRPNGWAPGRADTGVANWLRPPRITAVAGSALTAADSANGVAAAASGVIPSSTWARNLLVGFSKDVMSFRAEAFATLLCGPWVRAGGDMGGLASSETVWPMLGKLI